MNIQGASVISVGGGLLVSYKGTCVFYKQGDLFKKNLWGRGVYFYIMNLACTLIMGVRLHTMPTPDQEVFSKQQQLQTCRQMF